jgi:hypothetical protein
MRRKSAGGIDTAIRAYRIEQCPHLFEIDLPRAWHWLAILVGPVTPLQ